MQRENQKDYFDWLLVCVVYDYRNDFILCVSIYLALTCSGIFVIKSDNCIGEKHIYGVNNQLSIDGLNTILYGIFMGVR